MRIELDRIVRTYGGIQALRGVDLELAPGEVHALLGENGAGKSTLIKILTGVEQPDGGTIRVDGEAITLPSPSSATRLGISTVYQDLNLCPNLDVAGNLFLGREPRRAGGVPDFAAMRAHARRVLAELGCDVPLGTPVGRLPVSMQQVAAIARALTLDARLIIFDEPTSALNRRETEQLLALIRGLRSKGLAILYVTHKLFEVYAIADRVSILRDGGLAASGPVDRFAPAELTRAMLGQTLEMLYPPRRAADRAEVALEVEDLRSATLRGVTLKVHRGEILGVAGIEGSGAANLLRALFGLEPVTSGTVEVAGRALRPRSPLDAIAAGLAFVPADRLGEGNLALMSVQQNVLAVLRALGRRAPGGEQAAVERLLRLLNVRTAGPFQRITALSGGNQQKVIFARWLAATPRILLLDDPTRGVDVGAKAEIYRILRDLTAQGVSVVFSSSDVAELAGLSDRVVAVSEGRSAGELEATELNEERILDAITPKEDARALAA